MNLVPKVIYSTFTKHSGEIKVIEHRGHRRLLVGHLIQSVSPAFPEVEKKVWGRLLAPPFEIAFKPAVLVLGLGGGTVIHLLYKKFSPKSVRVFEIDEAILRVAQDFFNLSRLPGLEIMVGDALSLIRQEPHRAYDLIIVDLYSGQDFPLGAEQRGFYEIIKNLLKKGGVVSINRIFKETSTKERESYRHLLTRVFSEVREEKLPGASLTKNYLYFCRL